MGMIAKTYDIPEKLAMWLDKYLAHVRYEKNLSAKTLENYTRQLVFITQYLAENGIERWKEVTVSQVRGVLVQGKKQQLSPASLALRLSCFRNFLQFLVNEGQLNANPAVSVSAPKQHRPLPKNLDVEQMHQLLEFNDTDPLAIRDKAMMELMYSCGLRLSELASLTVEQVNRGEKMLSILGKGNKERMVPIGKMARDAIAQWLRVRGDFVVDNEQALFLSKQKRPITTRQIAKRMKLWGQKQFLADDVHPHKLRHSFASHMLESSQDLRAVQELLGHANLSTTQIYTHLDFQHLAKVYDKSHPRSKASSKK